MTIKKLHGHEIIVSHEDKVYFPKDKITKGQLLDYYEHIAPYILPYCKDRALTMTRYPEGITGESFYQKNAGVYFPDWIERKEIAHKTSTHDESTSYVVCQNAATLVYIANQGCITPHMWLSKIDKLDYPDYLIFDLDPVGKLVRNFKPIHDAALAVKAVLDQCGLAPFVMTTGSRGLHVRVHIKPELHFDHVREFAKSVAQIVVAHNPKMFTLEARKEKRGRKLLIDIMRNSFGATAVLPYAVRARDGAPVATPLAWEELEDAKLRSDTYTITNVFERLDHVGDAWASMHKKQESLKKAITKLHKAYTYTLSSRR